MYIWTAPGNNKGMRNIAYAKFNRIKRRDSFQDPSQRPAVADGDKCHIATQTFTMQKNISRNTENIEGSR